MSFSGRTVAPILVALVAGLAACSDAVGPSLENRAFEAVSVEGDPLPVTLTVSPTTEHRLLADVLTFSANGTARRTITTMVRDLATNAEHMETFERRTPYRVRGNRVILEPQCPMNPASSVSCVAADTAFIDGPNLLLRTPDSRRRRVLLVPATITVDSRS
jgi:hypothetical protein